MPFTFPDFVNPVGTKMTKKEKIEITVNAIAGSELVCQKMSHSMKVHFGSILAGIIVHILCTTN